MDFRIYFFLFLIYAIMGWCMEVVWGYIQTKKWVNRGFLIGPYCPIYGCGGLIITLCLSNYTDNPFAIFCMSIVLCGILEYLTSYIMEKIFKARWWDYRKRKFNINGRVCLETIIPFGLLSCMILYGTNPVFINLFEMMSEDALQISFVICILIFITDFIISFTVISRLRKTVKQVNKNETIDNTEEITSKVKEILLSSKSALDRRLIKAFPKISIEDVKKRIKETTEQVKESVAKVAESASEHIDEVVDHIKESAEKLKKKD